MLRDNTRLSSSTSLIDLAGQLYSPDDRHHYTRVILKKEQLWAQLEYIRSSIQQHYQQPNQTKQQEPTPTESSPSSTISRYSSTRHSMSSFSLLFTKSASMYQPQLEEYDTDFLSPQQIDRLSHQYDTTIQRLLQTRASPSPPSSTTSTLSKRSSFGTNSLTVKTANLSNQQRHYHQHLPISPPLSPPPSYSCLSTSPSTFFPTPPRSSSLQSSQPIAHKNNNNKSDYNISSISSQQQQYHAITTDGDDKIASSLFPPIIHIHKNNGMRIRSFLGQSMVLNKTIRLEHQRLANDARFYQGKDEYSGQVRAILKLSIIKLSGTKDPLMAPFGIQFTHSANTGEPATLALPDGLVREALHVWLNQSGFPCLSHACHVMRDGIKLYIIYAPSAISS
ncbi:hypothetical protein BC941DRAFT_470732 [Chlamydoabsidia padenii]|nr:hypothetical protein BC941DRAFT_470732 [Chlamydoabsidia padenii]